MIIKKIKIKNFLFASFLILLDSSYAFSENTVLSSKKNLSSQDSNTKLRICDLYGPGYFYIPGTETCFKIGGDAQLDLGFLEGPGGGYSYEKNGEEYKTFRAETTLSINGSLQTETKLGTLESYAEIDIQFRNQPDSPIQNIIDLDAAWIQIYGVRGGKDASNFTTFTSYAGPVILDDIVPYGSFDTNFISYTYDAQNGLSTMIAFEQGNQDNISENYTPYITGGIKYTSGIGILTGVLGFDPNYITVATKIRFDMDFNEKFSFFIMGGYGKNTEKAPNKNFYKQWNGNWAFWGGGSFKVSDKLAVNFQGSYSQGTLVKEKFNPDYGIVANFDYQLVQDFHIVPEINYFNYFNTDDNENQNGVGASIRLSRDF